MNVIVFEAASDETSLMFVAHSSRLCISIQAATREELHHAARDALIAHFGEAHIAYRVQIRLSPRRLLQPRLKLRPVR